MSVCVGYQAMCACVYVCVCMCVYYGVMCMRVCLYIYVCVCIYTLMYICVYVSTHNGIKFVSISPTAIYASDYDYQ